MTRVKRESSADPIEAELFGSNECRYRGITTRGQAPILAMCRALIGAGYDPDRPLHIRRGKVLALVVPSIGEAAKLTIRDSSSGRPKFRNMPPQEWAKVRQALTLPWRRARGFTHPSQASQMGEAAAPPRRGS